ncbi:MAG: hypothetical protein KBA31_17450 [Alphaproteobacteria bacterium]|nr:hypothetical protein [Alphaproteobacteria bacterium]
MTDQIQVAPPPVIAVPRAAPVVAPEVVEPAKKSQTENRKSGDQSRGEDQGRPSRQLSITRNEDLNAFVYRSIEIESGDVVWQWPSEDVLRRAESYRQRDEAGSHAVDEKA